MISGFVSPFIGRRAPFTSTISCCTAGPAPPPSLPPRARKLSLPTRRERRYLESKQIGRSRGKAVVFVRMSSFNLMVWPLRLSENEERGYGTKRTRSSIDKAAEPLKKMPNEVDLFDADKSRNVCDSVIFDDYIERRFSPTFSMPQWAYIVRVRASKGVLGKRAVQRNRAKRRMRAAAAQVFPDHGKRGMEYVFNVLPEVLTIKFPELVAELRAALRSARCWQDTMSIAELRREKYCE